MTTRAWRAGLIVALAWWSGSYGHPLIAPGWAGELRPDPGVDERAPAAKPGADQEPKPGGEARFPADLRAVLGVYPKLFEEPAVRKASEDWAVDVFSIDTGDRRVHQDDERLTDHMRLGTCIAVHVILLGALFVAGLEFYSAMLMRRKGTADVTAPPEQSEFQLKVDGIALKTSRHGSALLAFALAFYFLYIKFALPVT